MNIDTNLVYLTKEGLEELKKEYKQLTEVERVNVAKRIQFARDSGDISENADYMAARDHQSFIEGRILELEDILRKAKVIDDNKKSGIVSLGSLVKVHIEGEEDEFHIVGAPEANPLEKKISHESPLGMALLGKKVGDKIEVEAPMGKLVYKILNVK